MPFVVFLALNGQNRSRCSASRCESVGWEIVGRMASPDSKQAPHLGPAVGARGSPPAADGPGRLSHGRWAGLIWPPCCGERPYAPRSWTACGRSLGLRYSCGGIRESSRSKKGAVPASRLCGASRTTQSVPRLSRCKDTTGSSRSGGAPPSRPRTPDLLRCPPMSVDPRGDSLCPWGDTVSTVAARCCDRESVYDRSRPRHYTSRNGRETQRKRCITWPDDVLHHSRV